jgi:hypothetical protein
MICPSIGFQATDCAILKWQVVRIASTKNLHCMYKLGEEITGFLILGNGWFINNHMNILLFSGR